MKRQVQYPGVRKWSGDDLLELQGESLIIADKFFSQFGDCVITGCAVNGDCISGGLVSISGMVMSFAGIEGVEVFPLYLVKDEEHFQREYADEVVRNIAVKYFAKAVYEKPANDFIECTAEGAPLFFDNIKPGWVNESLINIQNQLKDLAEADADIQAAIELLLQICNELQEFDVSTGKRLTRIESLLIYTPTLAAMPTEATLTYQVNEAVQDFLIGQQCRVYDAAAEKYVFYQLYDITVDKKADWRRTIDEINNLEVVNSLPVNTLLRVLPNSANIFGEKWLLCDGSEVYAEDYPDLAGDGVYEDWSIVYPNTDHSIAMGIAKADAVFTVVANNGYNQPSYMKNKVWTTGEGYEHQSGYSPVLFGDGTFVILPCHLGRDKPHWSEDGKIWHKATNAVAQDYRGGCFGNGTFVISCESSGLGFYASKNYGRTWVKVATEITNNSWGRNICFGDSKFIIVNKGKVATSIDGITWQYSVATGLGAGAINNVCYGNKRYIAVGDDCKVYVSQDTVYWTQVTSLPVIDGCIPGGMAYGNGTFFVYAWKGSVGCQMFTKDNGLTWHLLPQIGSGNHMSDIYYFDDLEMMLFVDSKAHTHSLRKKKTLPVIEDHYIKALK